MVSLSIDSSSTSTGWALFIDYNYVKSGVIDLKGIKDSLTRLDDMVLTILDLVKETKPDVVVVEEMVVTRNPQVARMLTMILGAIYGYCIQNNISYCTLRPTEWRALITKDKKPRKREELKQWSKDKVRELFEIDDVNDDISDAILIGRAYVNRLKGE